MRSRAAATAVVLLALIATGRGQGDSAPKTPWGDPDLQGVWNFGTLTPLERPANWAGKSELTEEEAKKFEAE